MDKVVKFVQQRNDTQKRVVVPNSACFEYMREQMQDFREFGPDYRDSDDDYNDSGIKIIEILIGVLVVIVFIGSIVLLSVAIINLINTKNKVKKIQQEIDRYMITYNTSLAQSKGNSTSLYHVYYVYTFPIPVKTLT